MNPTRSRNDPAQPGAASSAGLGDEILSKRKELARLIGRLLAAHWLKQQRGRSATGAAKESVDLPTTPEA